MPKILDVWQDEDSTQFAIHSSVSKVEFDISGASFFCTQQDAREIGERLIQKADELEAKQ